MKWYSNDNKIKFWIIQLIVWILVIGGLMILYNKTVPTSDKTQLSDEEMQSRDKEIQLSDKQKQSRDNVIQLSKKSRNNIIQLSESGDNVVELSKQSRNNVIQMSKSGDNVVQLSKESMNNNVIQVSEWGNNVVQLSKQSRDNAVQWSEMSVKQKKSFDKAMQKLNKRMKSLGKGINKKRHWIKKSIRYR